MSCRLILNLRESDKHRVETDVHVYANVDLQLQAFFAADLEKVPEKNEVQAVAELSSETDASSSLGSRELDSPIKGSLSIDEVCPAAGSMLSSYSTFSNPDLDSLNIS